MSNPKLLADAMLGRLGKICRILGFDTALANVKWPDDQILEQALVENRLLLTRDRPFVDRILKAQQTPDQAERMKKAQFVYVPTIDLTEQLALVFSHLGLDPRAFLWEDLEGKKEITLPFEPRCTLCNDIILRVNKADVFNEVPPGSAANYNVFWQCQNPKCKKVYWVGKHFKEIRTRLELVSEKSKLNA